MLEILALVYLTRKIGGVVEAKGHKGGRYKVLTVVLWIGGEFVGAILGGVLSGGAESGLGAVYLFALLGAAAGAGLAYFIAANVPPAIPVTPLVPTEPGR